MCPLKEDAPRYLLVSPGGRSEPPSNMPEQSNDYRVAVFGAGGVGKSSLVLRFVKGTFRESYIPTVEDTYRQVISCDKSICTLQITDTTGSHQFPAMQRLSISKGHAFILVYSITSRQSLEELKPIYEQICEIKGDVESIPIMLVGNKCDESPSREVPSSEAEALALSRMHACPNWWIILLAIWAGSSTTLLADRVFWMFRISANPRQGFPAGDVTPTAFCTCYFDDPSYAGFPVTAT
ncbi:GTP-binding protein Di-Ras2 [Marmota marmota marmota]|uniref:GTP-binding protein Di-Ras2 n=1 Tax=Marmota marmota marmota TaxID=9994 RepID=UPI00209259D1|nr:GTP-binding protein Di-Ras2 [Marmota marmota marmota]